MKIQRALLQAGVAAVFLVGLQAFQAHLLRNALGQASRLMMTRLEGSLAGVLTQAHRSNDDLALFQVISAVAGSPGILHASIVDSEDRVLAHREPSKIGKPLDVSGKRVFFYSLRDGGHTWGRLALSVSDQFARKLVRRQWILGTAAASVVWSVFFLYWQTHEKQTFDVKRKLIEAETLLQMEKRRSAAAEGRETRAHLQSVAYVRQAVQRMADATIVLDAQQRLCAINTKALALLGVPDQELVLGKSWNETPVLNGCGTELQRSLSSMDHAIVDREMPGGVRVTFKTHPNGLSGTWVTLTCPSNDIQWPGR